MNEKDDFPDYDWFGEADPNLSPFSDGNFQFSDNAAAVNSRIGNENIYNGPVIRDVGINNGTIDQSTNLFQTIKYDDHLDNYIKYVSQLLHDGKFDAVRLELPGLLKKAFTRPEPHLYQLMLDYSLREVDQLGRLLDPLDNNQHFLLAYKYADPLLRARLEKYNQEIHQNIIDDKNKKLNNTYFRGVQLMRGELYEDAINIFEKIPGYLDADELRVKCIHLKREKELRDTYNRACSDFKEQTFEGLMHAEKLFGSIPGYADADKLRQESHRKLRKLYRKEKTSLILRKAIVVVFVLLIALIIASVVFYAMDAYNESVYWEENKPGTINNPIVISTPDELANIFCGGLASQTIYPDPLYYELGNDIDLSGYDWEPLGSESEQFSGILDGNGHKITNLEVKYKKYCGLFATLGSDSIIKNLIIEDAHITGRSSTTEFAGILAGTSSGSISNCVISGVVDGGGMYFGGIVGKQNMGLISSCSFTGEVLLDSIMPDTYNSAAGGITGESRSYTKDEVIRNCQASGTITGIGVTGGITGSLSNGIISSSSYSGTVKAEFSTYPFSVMEAIRYTSQYGGALANAGGIVGYLENGIIEDCHSSGTISSNEKGLTALDGYSGGLVGDIQIKATGEIRGSTSSATVYESDHSVADGICPDRYNSGTMVGNTFTGRIVNV